jgi:hypothetical protein
MERSYCLVFSRIVEKGTKMATEIKNKRSGWTRKTFDSGDYRAITILKSEMGDAFDYLLGRLGLPVDTGIVQVTVSEVTYCIHKKKQKPPKKYSEEEQLKRRKEDSRVIQDGV